MPIVTCPDCRSELEIPAELMAGAVRCGHCQTPFDPLTSRLQVPTVPIAGRRMPPPRRNLSKAWLWVLFAGCSLIALACMGSCLGLINVWSNPPLQPYSSPDGAFEAIFPGEPLPVVRKDDGIDVVGVESKREFPEETYFVERHENAKQSPKEAIDAWVRRQGATVVDRDAAKVHRGLDASEANGQLSITKGNFVLRAVKVGDAIYLVGIFGGVMPHSQYADRFLDSFKPKGAE